jgi:hypothetical protein
MYISVLCGRLPEAQFPSAVPPVEAQVSDDWHVPNVTSDDEALDKAVHWLPKKNMQLGNF